MKDKQGRTPLDVALGVTGGGRRGGAAGGGARGPVREKTAALLRELMIAKGLPVPPPVAAGPAAEPRRSSSARWPSMMCPMAGAGFVAGRRAALA